MEQKGKHLLNTHVQFHLKRNLMWTVARCWTVCWSVCLSVFLFMYVMYTVCDVCVVCGMGTVCVVCVVWSVCVWELHILSFYRPHLLQTLRVLDTVSTSFHSLDPLRGHILCLCPCVSLCVCACVCVRVCSRVEVSMSVDFLSTRSPPFFGNRLRFPSHQQEVLLATGCSTLLSCHVMLFFWGFVIHTRRKCEGPLGQKIGASNLLLLDLFRTVHSALHRKRIRQTVSCVSCDMDRPWMVDHSWSEAHLRHAKIITETLDFRRVEVTKTLSLSDHKRSVNEDNNVATTREDHKRTHRSARENEQPVPGRTGRLVCSHGDGKVDASAKHNDVENDREWSIHVESRFMFGHPQLASPPFTESMLWRQHERHSQWLGYKAERQNSTPWCVAQSQHWTWRAWSGITNMKDYDGNRVDTGRHYWVEGRCDTWIPNGRECREGVLDRWEASIRKVAGIGKSQKSADSMIKFLCDNTKGRSQLAFKAASDRLGSGGLGQTESRDLQTDVRQENIAHAAYIQRSRASWERVEWYMSGTRWNIKR